MQIDPSQVTIQSVNPGSVIIALAAPGTAIETFVYKYVTATLDDSFPSVIRVADQQGKSVPVAEPISSGTISSDKDYSGSVVIGVNGTVDVASTATINVNGTLYMVSSSLTISGTVNADTLVIRSGSSITVAPGATLSTSSIVISDSSTTITVSGGNVEVDTSLVVQNQATLEVTSGATVQVSKTVVLSSGGSLVVTDNGTLLKAPLLVVQNALVTVGLGGEILLLGDSTGIGLAVSGTSTRVLVQGTLETDAKVISSGAAQIAVEQGSLLCGALDLQGKSGLFVSQAGAKVVVSDLAVVSAASVVSLSSLAQLTAKNMAADSAGTQINMSSGSSLQVSQNFTLNGGSAWTLQDKGTSARVQQSLAVGTAAESSNASDTTVALKTGTALRAGDVQLSVAVVSLSGYMLSEGEVSLNNARALLAVDGSASVKDLTVQRESTVTVSNVGVTVVRNALVMPSGKLILNGTLKSVRFQLLSSSTVELSKLAVLRTGEIRVSRNAQMTLDQGAQIQVKGNATLDGRLHMRMDADTRTDPSGSRRLPPPSSVQVSAMRYLSLQSRFAQVTTSMQLQDPSACTGAPDPLYGDQELVVVLRIASPCTQLSVAAIVIAVIAGGVGIVLISLAILFVVDFCYKGERALFSAGACGSCCMCVRIDVTGQMIFDWFLELLWLVVTLLYLVPVLSAFVWADDPQGLFWNFRIYQLTSTAWSNPSSFMNAAGFYDKAGVSCLPANTSSLNPFNLALSNVNVSLPNVTAQCLFHRLTEPCGASFAYSVAGEGPNLLAMVFIGFFLWVFILIIVFPMRIIGELWQNWQVWLVAATGISFFGFASAVMTQVAAIVTVESSPISQSLDRLAVYIRLFGLLLAAFTVIYGTLESYRDTLQQKREAENPLQKKLIRTRRRVCCGLNRYSCTPEETRTYVFTALGFFADALVAMSIAVAIYNAPNLQSTQSLVRVSMENAEASRSSLELAWVGSSADQRIQTQFVCRNRWFPLYENGTLSGPLDRYDTVLDPIISYAAPRLTEAVALNNTLLPETIRDARVSGTSVARFDTTKQAFSCYQQQDLLTTNDTVASECHMEWILDANIVRNDRGDPTPPNTFFDPPLTFYMQFNTSHPQFVSISPSGEALGVYNETSGKWVIESHRRFAPNVTVIINIPANFTEVVIVRDVLFSGLLSGRQPCCTGFPTTTRVQQQVLQNAQCVGWYSHNESSSLEVFTSRDAFLDTFFTDVCSAAASPDNVSNFFTYGWILLFVTPGIYLLVLIPFRLLKWRIAWIIAAVVVVIADLLGSILVMYMAIVLDYNADSLFSAIGILLSSCFNWVWWMYSYQEFVENVEADAKAVDEMEEQFEQTGVSTTEMKLQNDTATIGEQFSLNNARLTELELENDLAGSEVQIGSPQ